MSAELKVQIGQRMRRIRTMRNLTQKELANTIVGRVDYTYVGKIERGAQLPSLKVLERLSEALGVPLAYFFQEESLSHLLPEELHRLSRDKERTALLREVARISRRDVPLLLEIIRALDSHRRMKGAQSHAIPYPQGKREAQRAADLEGQYRKQAARQETGWLPEAIEELDRLMKRARRSRLPGSQRAAQALQRARQELRRGVIGPS